MMVKFIYLLFFTVMIGSPLLAKSDPMTSVIKSAIRDLIDDNHVFLKQKDPEHFQSFSDLQNPRTTAVLCSDSRVQTDNFSKGAEKDLFVVRNIGNQIGTASGSVEYGVNVLETPVLLIVGHSHCGAVKAAMKSDPSVPANIQKELDTLDVKKASDDKEGVLLNVHHQVSQALSTFKERVDSHKLVIIGAIYDFRNDYGSGKGRLIIVNLNGMQDPEKISESHYFDGIKEVAVGVRN